MKFLDTDSTDKGSSIWSSIKIKAFSIFGMLTAIMVFLAGLLNMFDIIGPFSTIKGLIALPIAIYELSLATWLIIKGFNTEKLEILRRSKS